MLGLTLDKVVVVTLVAALVVGPSRLPGYVERVTATLRALRALVESSRERAETELGVTLDAERWRKNVGAYDPRRIVREALAAPAEVRAPPPVGSASDEPDAETSPDLDTVPETGEPVAAQTADPALTDSATQAVDQVPEVPAAPAVRDADPATAPSAPTERPMRWVVTGPSAHPRRRLVPVEDAPA